MGAAQSSSNAPYPPVNTTAPYSNGAAVCSENFNATYDNLQAGMDINSSKEYGAVNYIFFNVGTPYPTGSAIQPVSGDNFARASAAKSAASNGTLPQVNFLEGSQGFRGYPYDPTAFGVSFDFACATPGSIHFGTQRAVPCTLDVDAGVPPMFATNPLFNYTPTFTTTGRAQMTHVVLSNAYAYELIQFNATDAGGKQVDLFIDNLAYVVSHKAAGPCDETTF